MGFVDELRARNTSGGFDPGAAGSVNIHDGGQSVESVMNTMMPFIHQIRNRNIEDYKAKALFDNNLQMQQGGIRRLNPPGAPGDDSGSGQMNTAMGPAQNEITPFQRASLAMEDKKLNAANKSDADKLAFAKTTGDEKLGLTKDRLELDVLKNKQIYDTKTAEMERKADESTKKLQFAYDQLVARQGDAQAQAAFKEAQLAALTARHELEMAKKDRDHDETVRFHSAQMENMKQQLENAGFTMEDTEIDPAGNKRTVITKKGAAAKNAPAKNDPAGIRTK